MSQVDSAAPSPALDVVLSHEQVNTAMKSPQHLKAWLEQSGRRWVVLNAQDLVDALPWPSGVEAFVQVLMAYRDLRRTQPSGREERVVTSAGTVAVPVMRDETLELEELDRAVRYLIGQIYEKKPDWRLEDPAL